MNVAYFLGHSGIYFFHLKVGGETVDGPYQIIRQHGVENLPFQECFVPPVPDDDLVRGLDLETDLPRPANERKPSESSENRQKLTQGTYYRMWKCGKLDPSRTAVSFWLDPRTGLHF